MPFKNLPIAVLALVVLGVGCAPAAGEDETSTSSEDALDVRAAAGGDTIQTPFGLRHKTCVHAIADGAEVDPEGAVQNSDGSRYQLPRCEHVMPPPTAPASDDEPPPAVDGWILSRSWRPSAWIGKLTAHFTVPPAPHAGDSLVYFFPGLEPKYGGVIEQPVLAWGYGGPGWTISSWSCGSLCVHSPFVTVHAGDHLYGSMVASSCTSTGSCAWTVTTKDDTTAEVTRLHAARQEPMRWVFGGVLEAYGVEACDEYPRSGTEVFSSIYVYSHTGALLAPSWSQAKNTGAPYCGVTSTATEHSVTISHMCKPHGSACSANGQCCYGSCYAGVCEAAPSGPTPL